MRLLFTIGVLVMTACPAAAQSRQSVIPVAPAEITTTVPPGPETVTPSRSATVSDAAWNSLDDAIQP